MTLDKYFSTMKTLTDRKPAAINGGKELYGYKLPKEWKIVTLGEIFRVINKNTRKIRIEPDKEYKLIVTRLYAKGVELKEIKKGSQIKAKYMYIVKEGDFIFSKINVKKGALGFIPPELDGAVVTAEHPILRLDERKANKKFVFYYLSQPFIWNEFKRRSKGFADKSRTKINEFLEVKIALPPLEEQHKIVYVLDTIKHAIEVQDRLLDTLNELKRALMNRLFTKGLDPNQPTKQTEIGEIPAHWKLATLGTLENKRIISIIYGFPCRDWNTKGVGIPQLRPFNIDSYGKINLNNLKYITCRINDNSYYVRINDIIFNNTNSLDLVGKTAIWNYDNIRAVISNHMTIIRVLRPDIVNPEYLANYLYWLWMKGYFRKISSRHVNQVSISKSKLRRVPVFIPSIEEQDIISKTFILINEKIRIIEEKKSKLYELYESILHRLMTGQIHVTTLNEVYPSRKLPGV